MFVAHQVHILHQLVCSHAYIPFLLWHQPRISNILATLFETPT